MIKTTLQYCIDELKTRIEHYKKNQTVYSDLIVVSDVHVYGLTEAINILTIAIDSEKKQIIDAHIAGQKFASDNDNPDSEEYFNRKYVSVKEPMIDTKEIDDEIIKHFEK